MKQREIRASIGQRLLWLMHEYPAWLHTLVGPEATAYVIDPTRSGAVVAAILGLDYGGTLIHDGWSPYDQLENARHQQWFNHTIRTQSVGPSSQLRFVQPRSLRGPSGSGGAGTAGFSRPSGITWRISSVSSPTMMRSMSLTSVPDDLPGSRPMRPSLPLARLNGSQAVERTRDVCVRLGISSVKPGMPAGLKVASGSRRHIAGAPDLDSGTLPRHPKVAFLPFPPTPGIGHYAASGLSPGAAAAAGRLRAASV